MHSISGGEQPRAVDRAADGDGVEIRHLDTHEEREQCVRLQKEIWGTGFEDVVPASLIHVSQKVGGLAGGAFSVAGQLVGFVYGLAEAREGVVGHWSHMLGVSRGYRGRGIGKRLKCFQRDCLRKTGISDVRWTFDPLVASNAHFNVNVLGVQIEEYVPDMYAQTGSGMHSFGTDRLIAHWTLDGPEESRGEPGLGEIEFGRMFLINQDPMTSVVFPRPLGEPEPAVILVRIPADIIGMGRSDPEGASRWRTATRRAFQAALDRGFRVVGFLRAEREPYGHYVLASPSCSPEGRD